MTHFFHTLFFLDAESLSVRQLLLLLREEPIYSSRRMEQQSGIICLLVRLNHADKAELGSGSAGYCSLIITGMFIGSFHGEELSTIQCSRLFKKIMSNESWEV